jgi:hypothetical protein
LFLLQAITSWLKDSSLNPGVLAYFAEVLAKSYETLFAL